MWIMGFLDTIYIFKVNGASEVKSDAQLAMNKNLHHVQKIFRVGWGTVPLTQILFPKLLECVRNESS